MLASRLLEPLDVIRVALWRLVAGRKYWLFNDLRYLLNIGGGQVFIKTLLLTLAKASRCPSRGVMLPQPRLVSLVHNAEPGENLSWDRLSSGSLSVASTE